MGASNSAQTHRLEREKKKESELRLSVPRTGCANLHVQLNGSRINKTAWILKTQLKILIK
jgi:Fe-S cluster assembly iron-binding protein IscA